MKKDSEWTISTYAAYNEALREADHKFYEERDRRYQEKEQIKKEAEDKALHLAREIQIYKDEKANELREQINQERLLYVRKDDIKALEDKYDALIQPLSKFAASRQGREIGVDKTMYYVFAVIGMIIGLIGGGLLSTLFN